MLQITITTQDKEEFLQDFATNLHDALVSIFGEVIRMDHEEVTMGFASSGSTFTAQSVALVSYQSVGSDTEGREFILYSRNGDVGFGLYDPDKETALPIDIDFITQYVMSHESLEVQYSEAVKLVNELDRLLS